MRALLAILAVAWVHTSHAEPSAASSSASSSMPSGKTVGDIIDPAVARELPDDGSSASEVSLAELDDDEAVQAPREAREFEFDSFTESRPEYDEYSELTEQERLVIQQELERMNNTELEQLPQPEMFISHVRNYWRRQEETQQRIRNEILDLIIPRKKHRPPVRVPPQGVPGPPRPPQLRTNQRQDRPTPGRRNRPRQRDQVIGVQLPPPGFGHPPPERRRDGHPTPEQRRDIQDALASKPALAPFIFEVPGEGVIQLPPPPAHPTDISSPVFPPPFPVGAPAVKRPGRHGGRRRGLPANQEAPPRRSPPNQEQRRRPPPNHESTRRRDDGRRPPIGHKHQGGGPGHRQRRPELTRPEPARPDGFRSEGFRPEGFRPEGLRPEGLRPEQPRRDFGPSLATESAPRPESGPPPDRRPLHFGPENAPRPEAGPPPDRRPLHFGPENAPRPEAGPPADRWPLHFGPPDGGRFTPSDIDFGGSSFAPFRPVNNDLGVGRRECDFYAADICLDTSVYPREAIRASIQIERPLVDAMFAEVREQSADVLVEGVSSQQEELYDYTHYFGSDSRTQTERRGIGSHAHRDFAQDGGYLCPSEVKYARPKRAKNSKGEWKFIVNMDRYTQTLRMEKCMRPGGSCSYVSHHYKSQCSQVSNYHRLLSWDEGRGLHMDIFKVPVACSCHIQGYAYVYPPLGGASLGGHQSTIDERIDTAPGSGGRSVGGRPAVEPPSRRPQPPRPKPPATTPTTAAPTTAATTTTQPTTTTRRYRGISRLRPTRRQRPETKVTFPPYRPSRPNRKPDESSINIPGLGGAPEDQYFGNFGERIPADANGIRRRMDSLDAHGSETYHVPAVLPPGPPRQSPPEERINYGYHPIIDFFGK